MADNVWILGIHMTKFGKHPDKDTVDLASEAALGALKDAGVSMKDMGVLAAGNLMAASAGVGQMLQKQIGQTGIPVYNVANACATGATALRTVLLTIKAGEADMGLAVGVEQMGKGGLLGVGGKGDRGRKVYEPKGRCGSVMSVEGLLDDMIPVYQKHLSKSDVEAMIGFYSTPTGQKILREMPGMTRDGMQAMQPRLRQMMDDANAKIEKMVKEQIEKKDKN